MFDMHIKIIVTIIMFILCLSGILRQNMVMQKLNTKAFIADNNSDVTKDL